jgi:hypothetical protein
MSHKMDWFINYEPVNGGSFLMGNNVAGKIAGFGAVKIRMHDGTDRILKNVQHVPDLKKNIISLVTLDSLGNEYSDESGVIRVKKGSLVVLQGNKFDGLYFLQGSMVIDLANVCS